MAWKGSYRDGVQTEKRSEPRSPLVLRGWEMVRSPQGDRNSSGGSHVKKGLQGRGHSQ